MNQGLTIKINRLQPINQFTSKNHRMIRLQVQTNMKTKVNHPITRIIHLEKTLRRLATHVLDLIFKTELNLHTGRLERD